MVSGRLRLRNGYWHMNISYRNEFGKRISDLLRLEVERKRKYKRTEAILQAMRRKVASEMDVRCNSKVRCADTYFLRCLEVVELILSPTTYKSYGLIVRNSICPYFRKKGILLNKLKVKHIAAYYDS